MSNEDQEKFVEYLIRGLPKAEAMTEFELRRFEKLIDHEAAVLKASRSKRSFRLPAAVAASVALLFAGVLIFSQNNGTSPIKDIASNSGIAAPTTESENGPEMNLPSDGATSQSTATNSNSHSTKKPTTSTGTSTQETYNDQNQNVSDSVPVFKSNLDYDTQFKNILRIVKQGSAGSSLKSLTSAQQQCAIRLGLGQEVLAFDKGKFQGESIWAYYSGANPMASTVTIVSTSCQVIAELDPNL